MEWQLEDIQEYFITVKIYKQTGAELRLGQAQLKLEVRNATYVALN